MAKSATSSGSRTRVSAIRRCSSSGMTSTLISSYTSLIRCCSSVGIGAPLRHRRGLAGRVLGPRLCGWRGGLLSLSPCRLGSLLSVHTKEVIGGHLQGLRQSDHHRGGNPRAAFFGAMNRHVVHTRALGKLLQGPVIPGA